MSEITTSFARVEMYKSSDPEAKSAWLDISTRRLSGCASSVTFFPEWSYLLILKDKLQPRMHLVSIPHPKWEADLLEEFRECEIFQRFYEVKS